MFAESQVLESRMRDGASEAQSGEGDVWACGVIEIAEVDNYRLKC